MVLIEEADDANESESCPLEHGHPDRWTWSTEEDNDKHVHASMNNKMLLFHPNWSNGTVAVRGTKPLSYGKHYWEIHITQRIFGTSMMFGIGTKHSRLYVESFTNLLGEDSLSWGLSHKGLLWHNGKWTRYVRPFRENRPTVIGILLNLQDGTLTYYQDGVSQGVAFRGLNKVKEDLFPMVASTAARTQMTLIRAKQSYVSLQERCMAVIVRSLREKEDSEELPLPRTFKNQINEMFE